MVYMSWERVSFTTPAKDVFVKRKLGEEEVLNAVNSADEVFLDRRYLHEDPEVCGLQDRASSQIRG
jgi:hypothetical protein